MSREFHVGDIGLTFAELQFIVSLLGQVPLDLAGLLGLDVENSDALAASGLASLLARRWCTVSDQDVSLSPEVAEVAESLRSASDCYRVAIVSKSNAVIWQVFSSAERRVLITPLGHGVFQCLPMVVDADLQTQFVELLDATIDAGSESVIVESVGVAASTGIIVDRHGDDWVDRDPVDSAGARLDLGGLVAQFVHADV